MASTLYTSVQYRTVSAEHAAAEFPNASALIASGAVQVDPNPPFKGGGGVSYNVPYFLEISGADVVPTAATDGTRNAIATFKDVGPITAREYGLGIEASAQLAIGSSESINGEVERQVGNYWGRRLPIALYNVIKGAFASGGAMDSAYFVQSPGGPFTAANLIDTITLDSVGQNWEAFNILVLHSKQYAQLLKEGLVTYVEAGQFGDRLLQVGRVPTLLGKQIVVDDNIADTDGTCYLLKPRALYLGFQQDPGVEYQRDASLGGGTDEYWMRAAFMPHLYGLTYGGAAKPTNSTLATAGSWTLSQTTDYKLFRAVKIKFDNA